MLHIVVLLHHVNQGISSEVVELHKQPGQAKHGVQCILCSARLSRNFLSAVKTHSTVSLLYNSTVDVGIVKQYSVPPKLAGIF